MVTMLRTDLFRLRTLRSTQVLLLLLLAAVAGITAGSLTDAGAEGMTTPTQLREPLTASAGILVAVGLALFAAMSIAGDYRYGTIGQRLLESPRRPRLLVAMLAVHGLLGLVAGAVILVVGLAIAVPMVASADGSLGMTPQIFGAVLLAVVAFSLIGVCAAVIFRSQSAAALVLVGVFFAEKIVGIFMSGATEYLPYGLLTPLLRLEGASIGQGPAAASLVVITSAMVALAAFLFGRRDVTS